MKQHKYVFWLIALLFVIAAIGFLTQAKQSIYGSFFSAVVFLTLLTLLVKKWWPAITIIAITWTTEALGIAGMLFVNPYSYDTTFASAGAFGVPAFVPISWAVIVISLATVTRTWWKTGLGALLLDVLIEPIAVRSQWWTWEYQGKLVAPLLNFTGWFAVAALLYFVAQKAQANKEYAQKTLVLLTAYFTVLAVQVSWYLVLYGVLLTGAVLFWERKELF